MAVEFPVCDLWRYQTPPRYRRWLSAIASHQERRWSTLSNPKLTPEVCQQLADGVAEEVGGRSVPELEAERDRQLMGILRLRRASDHRCVFDD